MRFQGQTILITGGASGIGFATAKRIVSEGGAAILTGRDGEKLRQAARELGPNAHAYVADSAQIADLERLAETVRAKHGPLDGLFLNAGVAVMGPSAALTEADFDRLMNINIKGVFFGVQKLLPLLRDGASILINGSVAGAKSSPNMSAYGATKAAVRSLARSFSAELVDRKIRVNVVSPGPIETPIWEKGAAPPPKEALDRYAATNPSKRFGRPEEVAAVATFLLSSESTYVVGSEYAVDGGSGQL